MRELDRTGLWPCHDTEGQSENSDSCPFWFFKMKKAEKISFSSLFVRYNSPMAVTRRQKEILDFLESFVARNGYSPSFEEIARGMSLKSLATVHKHITNLEKKGLLDRVHNRSRSIDVLPPGARTRSTDRLLSLGGLLLGCRSKLLRLWRAFLFTM